MKRASMPESVLQQHVVKLLSAYARADICWWHVPNGELRNHKVGAKLKLAGLRPGVADLNFVIDGRFHAVELKTEIGTPSEAQLAFREDVERAGGFFHVAFGLDQALAVLSALRVFRANISVTTPIDGRGVRSRPWREQSAAAGKRGNEFTSETEARA